MIIKSFKACGIKLEFDGSNMDEVKCFQPGRCCEAGKEDLKAALSKDAIDFGIDIDPFGNFEPELDYGTDSDEELHPLNKDIEERDDGAGNSNNRCDDNKSDSDGTAYNIDNEIGGSGAVDEPSSSRYYNNCCDDSCDSVDSNGDDGGNNELVDVKKFKDYLVVNKTEIIDFMRKTRVTQTTNRFTSFENSKTFACLMKYGKAVQAMMDFTLGDTDVVELQSGCSLQIQNA